MRTIMVVTGLISLLILTVSVYGGELTKWQNQREEAVFALFRPQDASRGALILQQAASQGNVDAESDLTLAMLLGMGVPQDLDAAAKSSSALVDGGGARAHTTMGLLLAHNLTGTEMSEEKRQSQALSHYILAAMNNDPIAQILAGWHYLKVGDCDAALQYFRRAALAVIPAVPEEMVLPDSPRYVWPEDDSFGEAGRMTLDEFHFVELMAQHGDADAALKTAVFLYRGIPGLPRDLHKAAGYLRQAVKENSTSAMVMLSSILLRHNIPDVEENVVDLLQTALDFGEKSAHAYLGLLYLNGFRDVPKDLAKAKFHLTQGVLHGIAEAFYLLGSLYEEEESGGKSDEAIALWQVSASVGHVPSAFRVAERYWQELHRVSTNADTTAVFAQALCHSAVSMYRKVALSGDWHHLLESAYEDYINGYAATALMKYLLMSDLGYPSAHVNAGRLLDSGSDGIYKTEEALQHQAVKVWQKAADTGTATGFLRLGDIHYYGQGVPQDLTLALMYYNNASMLGSAHGLFNAAQMVEWGEGVMQNVTQAREMYESAQELSDDAYVPITLALARMDLFLRLNATFGLDLYAVNWSLPSFKEQWDHSFLLDTSMPAWDIILMIVLGVIIVGMVAVRARSTPHR
ncbi:protein sel-1 homolog 1-like isoform X1 [Penaeus japonicus]|uniref:protein sel-1 homolog 1-like isoform X1 n=2 Tax=Penaeus japonicus TaxID=27405 RepID=UPI001C70FCE8|nr:protein sel-1 homolog 1-like isoform X1 [Penaeus japonicus]